MHNLVLRAVIGPLLIIGLFAGVLGGLLGIGGSLVMIPAMTEVLGPDQHLYQAAAMIVNVFVALPAVYQHRRAKAIERTTVRRLIPITLLAIVGGVLLSELPIFAGRHGEPVLRGVFGCFLFLIIGTELFRIWRRRRSTSTSDSLQQHTTEPTWLQTSAVGLPTGLIAGILGVGGGAIAVPLQRRVLHTPLPRAIANSAALIVVTATIGAAVKNYAYAKADHGGAPFLLASMLIPTAIMGSLVGSRLTHLLPVRTIKVIFLIMLMILSVRLTRNAWSDIVARPAPSAESALFVPATP